DQVASSAGLGWTLNAGGYIQREAHGLEDEIYLPANAGDPKKEGSWVVQQNDRDVDVFFANIGGRTFRFSLVPDGQELLLSIYPRNEVKVDVFVNGVPLPNYNGWRNRYQYIAEADADATNESHQLSFNITDEAGNVFEF